MRGSSIRRDACAALGVWLACLLPGCAQPPRQLESPEGVVVKFVEGLEVSAEDRRFAVRAGPHSRMDELSITAALSALDATLRSAPVQEIQRVYDDRGPRHVNGRDLFLYYEIRMVDSADATRLSQGLRVNPLVAETRLHPFGVPIPRPVDAAPEVAPESPAERPPAR